MRELLQSTNEDNKTEEDDSIAPGDRVYLNIEEAVHVEPSNNNNSSSSLEEGDKDVISGTGNSRGKIVALSSDKTFGVALMRLENLEGCRHEGTTQFTLLKKIAKSQSVGTCQIQIFRPDWWPHVDPVTGKSILNDPSDTPTAIL